MYHKKYKNESKKLFYEFFIKFLNTLFTVIIIQMSKENHFIDFSSYFFKHNLL